MLSDALNMNDAFSKVASSQEGRDKLADYAGPVILDRLRENSFARRIITPVALKPSDCQIHERHDTLVKMISIEPKSRAMTLNFRAAPRTEWIRAPRVPAAFFTISSPMFQKTEQELQVYDFPITRVLEENVAKDMEEIEDREFLIHAEACVQALQEEANGGAATALNASSLQGASPPVEFSVIKGRLARNASTNDAVVRAVQRPDLVDLFNLLDGNRLKTAQMLWPETDWNNILQWTLEDQGDRIQSETAVEGWKSSMVLGRRVIRSIKTDILRRGNIYSFTEDRFLGRFYTLNATKFFIEKKANLISFQSWEDLSITFVNIASVRKLELYSGDASNADADGLRDDNFLPKAEENLGAINNRAERGKVFPQISQY